MSNLTVGQKLWFVSNDNRRDEREVTVTHVGRKWAGIGYGYRIDINSLEVDGGKYASPGQCYLSRDEWEYQKARTREWWRLREHLGRYGRIPEKVSLNDILVAGMLLGLRTRASDERPTGAETAGLGAKPASAVAAGEAPHPTPPGVTHVDR